MTGLLPIAAALLLAEPAVAQTPSPLQEWQYSAGIVLQSLFQPHVPDWQTILGAAGSLRPLYDGSQTYVLRPGLALDIRYKDTIFFSDGAGLGADVLHGSNYRAGIALTYDLGRPVSENPSHLEGLGSISPAAVVKLFGEYAVSKQFPLVVRIDARHLIGGSSGYVGDLSAYMPLPGSSERLVMFAGPSVTYADGTFMQNTFGINLAQSVNSGLREYKAHAGLKAVGFGFTATWFMTEHWLLNGEAAISRLLNDAAASPITQQNTEKVLTLTVAYKF